MFSIMLKSKLREIKKMHIGIGRSLTTPPSHTTQHTGPYCAIRLIKAENQVQGNERPSDLK